MPTYFLHPRPHPPFSVQTTSHPAPSISSLHPIPISTVPAFFNSPAPKLTKLPSLPLQFLGPPCLASTNPIHHSLPRQLPIPSLPSSHSTSPISTSSGYTQHYIPIPIHHFLSKQLSLPSITSPHSTQPISTSSTYPASSPVPPPSCFPAHTLLLSSHPRKQRTPLPSKSFLPSPPSHWPERVREGGGYRRLVTNRNIRKGRRRRGRRRKG